MSYKPFPTCYWADDTFLGLSFEQKTIFNYLHVGPYNSQCGIFKLPVKTMGFHLGYTEKPIENAIRGLCSVFPDFVAWDEETGEVGLLQYAKQLHLSAGPKVFAIVEKDLQEVRSQHLLRLVIEKNSSTLSKPYLSRLRQLQAQKINEKNANCEKKFDSLEKTENDGDLHNYHENQEDDEKRKEKKRKENVQHNILLESENFLELENEAPQVKANPEQEDSAAPPLSVKYTLSKGEDEYKQTLMGIIKKFARGYWERQDIGGFVDYCWKNGKEFEIKTWNMKKTVPGLLELLKTHFEGDIGEMNKKKEELKADHSEVEKIVNAFLDECEANWKSDNSTYKEFQGKVAWNRNVRELDFEALKRLYLDNKWHEVTFVRQVYDRWRVPLYNQMGIEWSKFAATRKATMEVALEGYNYYSWTIEGWPKKK